MAKTNALGYRGYIASRPVAGNRTAQHIQNLVVRDYASRNGFAFKLSATELTPDNCFIVLDDVLDQLDEIDGIICYSLFMLPEDAGRRRAVFRRVLNAGKSLHAAAENLKVETEEDLAKVEDIWRVQELLTACPQADELRAWNS